MRGVAKHSVDLGKISPSQEEPSGAPSNPAGTEPMDEDPSNEAIILSLLEGYGADEAEAMDIETGGGGGGGRSPRHGSSPPPPPPPVWRIREASTFAGWIEGSYPRIGPR
jgi:hypothetical protein